MSIQHQEHFGRRFYKDLKTGYWISTDYPRTRAHRWVWTCHYGIPPKGYHVHHKNEDKSDNSIGNLDLLSAQNHYYHHLDKSPEKLKKAKENCDRIRHLTKAWHRSEEGLAWHKAHGILTWIDRKPIEITCLMCGKVLETKTYHQKFCHANCKAKHLRRRRKLNDPTT